MIRVALRDRVATLTLDRPPLNVLDIAMMHKLETQLVQLRDSEAKVVVLAANGKAFCAGVDVADHTAEKVEEMIQAFHGVFRALWALPQPVLGVVAGAALGGGMELALACDLLVAADKAKFGQPEIKVGVFPPIAALLLPRMVGRQAALECILTGETWSAERAFELGLVNALCPADQLTHLATTWAQRLVALSGPIVQLAKKATLIGWDQATLDSRLTQIEQLYLKDLMALEDAHEGLAAFVEKRHPRWKDR